MTLDILSFLLGLGLGLAVAGVAWFFLLRSRDAFRSLSQDIIEANNEAFLALAQERLARHQEGAAAVFEKKETAIKTLVEPVSKHLEQLQTRLNDMGKDHAGLRQQIHGFTELQDRLRIETRQLSEALRNPRSRGHWGEQHLQTALETAGMVEDRDYILQRAVKTDDGVQRPDVVIKLSGGRSIVIDSKVPLENFLNAQADDITPEQRQGFLAQHAASVRQHIKELSRKSYWEQFDSPEFVVMFLPSEGMFHAALKEDPTVLEVSARANVLIVSPYTLMALLKTIAFDHKQEKLAEHAAEISKLGQDLYKNLATFAKHMMSAGSGLNKAQEHYNKAITSLETRVLSKARKFEALGVASESVELPKVPQLDQHTRQLTAPELIEDEKPRKTG